MWGSEWGSRPSAGEELGIPAGLGGILMEGLDIPRILMEKLGIPGGFALILMEKPRIPTGFARILTEELGILHWAWNCGDI